MSLFDVLSKGFCSKKRESNEILSQEEYKDKFLHGDEYIKRELYDEYISRRLSEEFGLKYNEKIKKWHSEWSANRRFVVELCYPRGNHIYLRWGYNYDFIPDINSKNKLTWHRTECEFPYKSRVMGTSEPLKPLKAPYMARNPVKWGFFRLKGQEIPLKI